MCSSDLEAFETYRRICPAYLEDISEIHTTEPYVYSQTIAGRDSHNFGSARNSWLTGTAAWTYVNVSQYIIGIRPTYDGLEISPCLPKSIPTYTATRLFRDCQYHITVTPSTTKAGIYVDDTPITGNVIPLPHGKQSCEVIVYI